MESSLPLLYRWVRAHQIGGITPWHFVDDPKWIESHRKEYRLEVGGRRDILPFAHRQDMDTVAGFVVDSGQIKDQVVTVHLTWKMREELPGWPDEIVHPTFQQWITAILIPDAADWMSEEDLENIEKS